MEEDQNQERVETQETTQPSYRETQPSGVSFPTVESPKKSGGAKTLLIIGILILVGILGFVIYKSANKESDVVTEPTPLDNLTSPSQETLPSASATPAATPKVADKAKVAIEVQNGTGITGEAAYLSTQLKNLGYTDVKAGNAPSDGATTTQVTFAKTLDASVVSEITQKLNSLYQNVSTTTSASATKDVVIVTGLRKGATAKPSATPTSTPSASKSPSPTPTATAQ
jgi:hypothetical protein